MERVGGALRFVTTMKIKVYLQLYDCHAIAACPTVTNTIGILTLRNKINQSSLFMQHEEKDLSQQITVSRTQYFVEDSREHHKENKTKVRSCEGFSLTRVEIEVTKQATGTKTGGERESTS